METGSDSNTERAPAGTGDGAPTRRRSRRTGGDGDGGNGGGSSRRGGNGGNGGGNGRGGRDTAAADERALQRLLTGLREMRDGDVAMRLPEDGDPLMAEIASTFNQLADRRERLAGEIIRISTTIGREGSMTDRATMGGDAGGDWARSINALNALVTDLATPTTEVARVLEAVARGDLSQKMVLQIEGKTVQGEFLRIGTTVNTMVDQLSSFAAEVTRVAREVGTDGRLGGQANVTGVAGTWKVLTDSVNAMASNLTSQVRNIADVTTAVAKGDLSR